MSNTTDYEIGRQTGTCHACGRVFEPDERIRSVIVEGPQGFARRDACEACWSGAPADALCHFVMRVPRRTEKRRVFVDDEALVEFFLRLADATDDPLKRDFRFVLMLILMRKRLVKYEGGVQTDDGEAWSVRLVRDQSLHQVVDPHMDEARVTLLTGELGAIMQGDVAEPAGGESAASPAAGHE